MESRVLQQRVLFEALNQATIVIIVDACVMVKVCRVKCGVALAANQMVRLQVLMGSDRLQPSRR